MVPNLTYIPKIYVAAKIKFSNRRGLKISRNPFIYEESGKFKMILTGH